METHGRSLPNQGIEEGVPQFLPVIIIGAGASGIAMGCRLIQDLAFEDFKIFERQSGIGGTWWSNRYPGVMCDVPTALYSFSFSPNYTSKTIYPSGNEYLRYLNDVAKEYQLGSKIQLNANISSIRYLDDCAEWEVTVLHLLNGQGDLSAEERCYRPFETFKSETIRAKIVVSGAGILVEPNTWPQEITGRGSFEGNIVHSSRLKQTTDLCGKNVVVIGSGCSAAQIVPEILQTDILSLTQIIRTPPWVEPRMEAPLGEKTYARFAPTLFRHLPFLGLMFRCAIYVYTEVEWATVFQARNRLLRGFAERSALRHMRRKVPNKYHEIMTPKYSYGCKRRVFDSAWLESMNNNKFRLLMQPISHLGPRAVFLKSAASNNDQIPTQKVNLEIDADVIVLANGFQATRFLHPLRVYGRHGESLHDKWSIRGGEQAYMGTAMDGFPNFFMTVGPNTFVGHSSVILGIESTIGYILKLVSPILKGHVEAIEPTTEATLRWTTRMQSAIAHTVFAGCNSWYKSTSGWNSVIYPYSFLSDLFFVLQLTFIEKDTLKLTSKFVVSILDIGIGIYYLQRAAYAKSNEGKFLRE